MAGLGNTGIKGFIGSAVFTGQKILKKGKEIPEMVEDFISGFFGKGWKIWQWKPGRYKMEIDDLTVRGSLSVFELLIQKIRAVKGALAISQGQGKIESVTLSSDMTEYLIKVEEDMSFTENDFILCQQWSNGIKRYHVMIDKIVGDTIHIPIFDEGFDLTYDEFDKPIVSNAPQVGDEIIQFGNLNNTNRQSAIYLHADETGQPAIDVMFGINSRDWSDNLKIRLGGDIPGTNGLKGFYVENGMIKGVQKDADGNEQIAYALYPNGMAEFASNSVRFRPNGSGYIANGAISWSYNTTSNKWETNLNNVSLNWSNLDEDVKREIKPYIGDNGNWWIGDTDTGVKAKGEDGIDGTDGKNGVDGTNGTDGTDGKDGNDGKDGVDGNDGIGQDGKNGLNGMTILKSEWKPGARYYNEELKEPTLDGNGDPIPELRYLSVGMVKDNTMNSGWRAYKCIKTHDSTIHNAPPTAEFWEEFDANLETIFTSLIIADRADIANFIFFDGNLISKKGKDEFGNITEITSLTSKEDMNKFIPNIILNGNDGRIKANDAEISGSFETNSNGNRIRISKNSQSLRLFGSDGRVLGGITFETREGSQASDAMFYSNYYNSQGEIEKVISMQRGQLFIGKRTGDRRQIRMDETGIYNNTVKVVDFDIP